MQFMPSCPYCNSSFLSKESAKEHYRTNQACSNKLAEAFNKSNGRCTACKSSASAHNGFRCPNKTGTEDRVRNWYAGILYASGIETDVSLEN